MYVLMVTQGIARPHCMLCLHPTFRIEGHKCDIRVGKTAQAGELYNRHVCVIIKLVQVIDPVSEKSNNFDKDLSAGPAWFGRACKACKLKRYRNDCGAHYNKKKPVPGN